MSCGCQDAEEVEMSDKIAKPVNDSYGENDGVEITEDVIARLVKNAEAGFPDAMFRSPATRACP